MDHGMKIGNTVWSIVTKNER